MKKEKNGPEDKEFKKPIKEQINNKDNESEMEIKKMDDLDKLEKIIKGNTFITQNENDIEKKSKNGSDNNNIEEAKNENKENV